MEPIINRKERFELVDGTGLIRIEGDSFETALFIDGTPIALFWNDNEGSIEQLLARAHVGRVDAKLAQLRSIAGGDLHSATLAEQLRPLLELFENGSYILELRTLGKTWDVIDISVSKIRELDGFYPLDTYVATERRDLLSPQRVEFYVSAIRRGHRPIVFAAATTESNTAFVIDGHHKLAAYESLRLSPLVLDICREAPPRLDALNEKMFFVDNRQYRELEAARERGR